MANVSYAMGKEMTLLPANIDVPSFLSKNVDTRIEDVQKRRN